MAFHIDSDAGRIGPFWWINADLRPLTLVLNADGAPKPISVIRFGTCGFGHEPFVVLTSLS